MSQPHSIVAVLLQSLLATGARTITDFRDPKHITRVTRQGKLHRGEKAHTFLVTIGRPNYAERQLIKARVAVGAPFPTRKAKHYKR